MFLKSLSRFALVLLALPLGFSPSAARADDTHLMVHYDCQSDNNRLIVKTFITDKNPMQAGKDNLPFITMVHWSLPLECGFRSGDEIRVKAYYGNGEADTGAYQHVAIIVNGHTVEKLLDFNPDRTDAYRITAPSTYLHKHPQQTVRDPLEDIIGELPPGYINFDGMSAMDKHKLLADIRNRQP